MEFLPYVEPTLKQRGDDTITNPLTDGMSMERHAALWLEQSCGVFRFYLSWVGTVKGLSPYGEKRCIIELSI